MARFLGPRLAVLSWLALVLALLPLAAGWLWPAELAAHFTAHLVATAAVLALLLLALRRPVASLAAMLAVAIGLSRMLPVLSTAAEAAPSDASGHALRVLQWNVLRAGPDAAAQVAWIRGLRPEPDMLVLFETGAAFARAARALDDRFVLLAASLREDNFGIMVLSRSARATATLVRHAGTDTPSVHIDPCPGASASARIVATHPPPPLGKLLYRHRSAQLAEIAEQARDRPGELVVLGDMNVTPWSPDYHRFVTEAGLRLLHAGPLPPSTWAPGPLPLALGLPIDLVSASPGVRLLQQHRGPRLGSDHAAVISVLLFPGAAC
jgi:endonuclease/exonuclease/phosphatase (EEP) superfamily protein YafD